MKFKIDENLRRIASVWGLANEDELKEFSGNMCRYFINAGIIEDTPDNWGESVLIASGPQYVKDVCDLLARFLKVSRIHTDVFDAFCRLIVMGDGDCPKCGGELYQKDRMEHELNDGDHYTPASFAVDCYVYECRNCGETIKTKNEL